MTLYEFVLGVGRGLDKLAWNIMHTDLAPLFGTFAMLLYVVVVWGVVCYLYQSIKEKIRILLRLDPPPIPEESNYYSVD